MCMNVLPEYMYACIQACVPPDCGRQKKVLTSPKLELQATVSHLVGAGNWSQVLCKNNQPISLTRTNEPSHLFILSPQNLHKLRGETLPRAEADRECAYFQVKRWECKKIPEKSHSDVAGNVRVPGAFNIFSYLLFSLWCSQAPQLFCSEADIPLMLVLRETALLRAASWPWAANFSSIDTDGLCPSDSQPPCLQKVRRVTYSFSFLVASTK